MRPDLQGRLWQHGSSQLEVGIVAAESSDKAVGVRGVKKERFVVCDDKEGASGDELLG